MALLYNCNDDIDVVVFLSGLQFTYLGTHDSGVSHHESGPPSCPGMEVLDWVSHFRIVLKAWHHELLQEAVRSDFHREWRVTGVRPARLCLLPKKL